MTELIEVKTSELEGEALNWAVAKAEGLRVKIAPPQHQVPARVFTIDPVAGAFRFNPGTEWRLTGPFVDSHGIDFSTYGDGSIMASTAGAGLQRFCDGPTRLVAACRLIVTLRLSASVMVPVELVAP